PDDSYVSIARKYLADQLPSPRAAVIVEEEPAVEGSEEQHHWREPILVGAHMSIQNQVGSAAVTLGAAAMDAIGIVMRPAARIPIMLGAVHEDAVATLFVSHQASKQ